MKKVILFFLSAVMVLAISASSFAQQVSLTMKRPPLNQLKAADLWSATIVNGGESFTAYLYGSMTNNENSELIATGQTVSFEVKRGTTNFKVSDLPKIPDVNYLAKDPKYKTSFMNTGGAPPGDYKICVELRYTNNTIASDDCFDQKIMGGDAPQLISPRNEEELKIDNPVFTWMHMKGPGSTQTYKIKIVEIKGNESPENAMLRNKAFFEKEGISTQLFPYPVSADKFEKGKKYAWQIITGDLKSEVNVFKNRDHIDQDAQVIQLTSPSNGITVDGDSVTFAWSLKMKRPPLNQLYFIKIVEIKGDESPEEIMLKNKAFFEKEGIKEQLFKFPNEGPKFEDGKTYAWQVSIGDLKSETTNFIVAKKQPDKKNNCEASCLTNSIVLNTGYNRSNNTVNSSGVSDELWVLVGTPNTNISVPRIPTVITPNTAWVTQPNSAWISPYPTNSLNTNNADPLPFYMFEACFCLCEESTINLHLSIAADDAFQFSLDNTVISSVSSLAFRDSSVVNYTTTLSAGTHCLRIGVRNLGGVAMGLNVSGFITGASLLSQSCCNNKSKLTGMKFKDLNCNGIKEANEPGLSGWTIQLNNGQSKITDAGGFYTFTDLDAGNYIVTEVNQAGWTQTMPSSGSHNVNLASQEVISNLDFGNCEGVSNPCDSLSASVSASPLQGCCWSINLTTPVNNSAIKGIQFLALSPNSFVSGSSSLGSAYSSGWIFPVNNGQEFKIKKLGGNIPAGQLNGFFNFCLNKLSSPQNVVVNWLSSTDSIICSDTISTYCEIPCVTFMNDTLICNGNNYDLKFSLTNNASFPIGKIDVVSASSGVTVSPSTLTLSPSVNPNQTSSQTVFSLSGAVPNTQACVVFKFTSPDGCCWCYDTLCVDIPSCMCEEVGATVTGDPLNCCYSLNLQNNYSGNYFTQVTLTTLEQGVTFNTWYTNTAGNFYSTNNYPSDQIHLINDPANFPNSYIPTGNSANVLNFCLRGYTSTTQHVLVQWMRGDSVKCTDTLTINCIPPSPPTECTQLINDTLVCLPDGTYQYTFHVKNNSSHTTTGFQFNPISSGLVFTPANFSNVTIAPGMISPQQTMIISGVSPGSQFCFNISLYEHILLNNQQYYDWCCYSEQICKTVPDCPTTNECKFEVMIDSAQCKQNAAGQWYYNVSTRIYNSSGSPATLISVLADNGNMNCTPTNLTTGINQLNCSYTLTGPLTNPVCFTYRILKPGSRDTCTYKICREIFPCNPPPQGCDCKNGKWDTEKGTIRFGSDGVSTDKPLNCNSSFTVDLNSDVSLFPVFHCAQENCPAQFTYRVNGGAMTGFETYPYNIYNINTTTDVMIYAWCGDKICDSCRVTINVSNKDCGCTDRWNVKGVIGFNDAAKKYSERKIKCFADSYGPIQAGSTITFNGSAYSCKPRECDVSYIWKVVNEANSVISSGVSSTLPVTFTAPPSGAYTFVINANCGGRDCDSCGFYFKTEGKAECDCNEKATFSLSSPEGRKRDIVCGETITSTYQSNLIFTPLELCIPKDCLKGYSYEIFDLNTGAYVTGASVTGSATFNVTLNSYAGYKIVIDYNCDGKKCKCEIIIRTKETGQRCDCGSWKGDNKDINFSMGMISGSIKCDGSLTVMPGISYTFNSPTYMCNPYDANCQALYIWSVDGVQQSTSSSFTYSFSRSAIVSLKVKCGDKICDSCNFKANIDTPTGCDTNRTKRFSDNVSFSVGLNSPQIIDFATNQDGTPISPTGNPFGLSGWVRNGLTFSNTSSYWNSYIVSGANQYMTIVFPSGLYKKVGFDVGTYSGAAGNYIIKITSGNCVYEFKRYNISYFGIKLPDAIDKIEITCTNDTFLIDNLKFDN